MIKIYQIELFHLTYGVIERFGMIKCKKCNTELTSKNIIGLNSNIFSCPTCGEYNILKHIDVGRLENVSLQIFCALISKYDRSHIKYHILDPIAKDSMYFAKRFIEIFDKNSDKLLKEDTNEINLE